MTSPGPPDRKRDLLLADSTLIIHDAQVRLLNATGSADTSKSWLQFTPRTLSAKHLNSRQKAEFEIDQAKITEVLLSEQTALRRENTLVHRLDIRLKATPEKLKLEKLKFGFSMENTPENLYLNAQKINTERLLSLSEPFIRPYGSKIPRLLIPNIEKVLVKKTADKPFYFQMQGEHPLLKQWEIESEPSKQPTFWQLRLKADGLRGQLQIGQRQTGQGITLALNTDIPDIRSVMKRLETTEIKGLSPTIKDHTSLLAKYLGSGSLKSDFHWYIPPQGAVKTLPTGTITLEKLTMPELHLADSKMTVLLGTDKLTSKFTGHFDGQPLTVEAFFPLKNLHSLISKESSAIHFKLNSGPLPLHRLNSLLDNVAAHHLALAKNGLHDLQGTLRAEQLLLHLPIPFDPTKTDLSGTLHFQQVKAQSRVNGQAIFTPTINGAMAFSPNTLTLKPLQLRFTGEKQITPQTLELQGAIALKKEEGKNNLQLRTATGSVFRLEALNPFITLLVNHFAGHSLSSLQAATMSGGVQVNAKLQGDWRQPAVSGSIKLKDAALHAALLPTKGKAARTFWVHHANGALTFQNKHLLLQPLSLTWNQIQWKLSGKLSPSQSDLWVLADIPDVDPLYQPFAPDKPYIIFDTPFSVRHVHGKAQTNIHWIQGNALKNRINGSLNLQAVRVDLGPKHPPIEFNKLLIAIKPGPDIQLEIAPTQGKCGNLPLNLSSTYRTDTQQNAITLGPIDAGLLLTELKSHNKAMAQTLAAHSAQGTFSVVLNPAQTINTQTAGHSLELILNQLQWDTAQHHINHLSGNILVSQSHSQTRSPAWHIESENLRFHYNQRLVVQAPFSLKIPSSQTASGVLHLGVSDLEKQAIEKPDNSDKNPLQCELPWELIHTQFNLHNAQCQLQIAQNTYPFSLQGGIDNIQHPFTSGYQWELASTELRPDLNLKLSVQNPFGFPENMSILGYATWQDLKIPFLSITNTSGKAEFTGTEGSFSVSEFRIPGLDAQMTGKIEDLTHYPFRLSEVSLKGKRFVVPLFQKYMTQVVLEKFQKNWLEKLFGPLKPEDPVVPYEFQAAPVAFDSVVYDDVLLSHYVGKLSIFPTSYFELNDVQFKAAGGEVSGALSMDPLKNNHMSLSLNLHKVKVNPLAKTLLNAPNVIFGDMDGKIQVSSQGETDDELVKNADGTVGFMIENGRLPAVAKLETILTAANLLRGGIAGLSLNNLFRALSPLDTNYFAKLSGDFRMLSGVGHTDNLLSNGKDLSLAVKGRVNMLNAAGDLQVIGAMSQNVNGVLGHFGKANLTSALHWVPVLGSLPNGKEGLIYHIPGIGYIPGLGGIPKEVHRFQVNVIGPVYQLRSIKDFRWLTE